MTIDEFLIWLDTRPRTDSVVGLSELEIDTICHAQDVPFLPDDYTVFLRAAGRRAGTFGAGSEMFYPLLLETKAWMTANLRAHGTPFELPSNSFVFVSHGGYDYWYFVDATSDSPIVANWQEDKPRPNRLFRTFSDWLLAEVNAARQLDRRHVEFKANEPLTPIDFSYEQYRTVPPHS